MVGSPKLSIVVVCYNRRDYLQRALDSAINQDTDRELYEIILIKNFYDDDIDLYCSRFDVKNIIMSGTIGHYLHRGISEARGEIISFLEDDDEFTSKKVSTLIRIYEKQKFNFLHNGFVEIDHNGIVQQSIRRKLHMTKNLSEDIHVFDELNQKVFNETLKADADFNLSCMSISSTFASNVLDYTTGITAAPDGFLFYLALDAGSMIIVGDQLTRYRMHESTTNTNSTFTEFQDHLEREGMRQLSSMQSVESHIRKPIVRKYLADEITIKKLKILALARKKISTEFDAVQISKIHELTGFHLKFFFLWSTVYISTKLLGDIPKKIVYKLMLH